MPHVLDINTKKTRKRAIDNHSFKQCVNQKDFQLSKVKAITAGWKDE